MLNERWVYDVQSPLYNSFLSSKGKRRDKDVFASSKGQGQQQKVRGSDGKYQGE